MNVRSRTPATRQMNRSLLAFTLMEILVVLVILGLLAGLAINNFGGISAEAEKKTAGLFVNTTLKTSLMSYKFTVGDYPSTAEGLNALVSAPANKVDRWKGPFVEGGTKALNDPWQEPYQYRYPGVKNKNGYDIWSKGPDKQDGTEDDIGNWAKEEAGK